MNTDSIVSISAIVVSQGTFISDHARKYLWQSLGRPLIQYSPEIVSD